MMGKSSQRKGAAGEKELAEILLQHGYDCIRGGSLTFGEVPDITGLPGVHIECKRVEHFQLYPAMEQAQRDSIKFGDGVPVVFHRSNRHPWVAVMTLTDWLDFYRVWVTLRQGENSGE